MFTDDSDYVVEQHIRPNKVRKPLINDERADLLGNFDDDDAKFKKKKVANAKPIVFASEEDPFADAVGEGGDDENGNATAEPDHDTSNNDDDDRSSDDNVMPEKGEVENSTNKNASSKIKISDIEEETPASSSTTKTKKSNRKSVQQSVAKNSQNQTTNLTDEQIQALIRGSSKKDRFVLYITNLNYSTTREALTEFFQAAGQVKSVRVPKVRRSAFAFVEMCDIDGFKVIYNPKENYKFYGLIKKI